MHERVSVVRERSFHWLVALLLAGTALALYGPVLAIRPLRGDNLYVLAWVDAASFADLWRLDPAIYPEWRPLAYQAVWLEHYVVGLRAVAIHHGVNLALWIGCAWLVYRIVVRLSDSPLAGTLAALILVTDERATPLMTWIVDRQGSMACLFGLLALDVMVRTRDRALNRFEGMAVWLCLLCSALSKEYGLAFTAAFLAFSAWRRSPDVVWPAAAAAAYLTLRVGLAGGALGTYCEDMGFGVEESMHCIDLSAAASWRQMAYNLTATAIGIPLHGVFDESGRLAPEYPRLLTTVVVAVGAMVGDTARAPGQLADRVGASWQRAARLPAFSSAQSRGRRVRARDPDRRRAGDGAALVRHPQGAPGDAGRRSRVGHGGALAAGGRHTGAGGDRRHDAARRRSV